LDAVVSDGDTRRVPGLTFSLQIVEITSSPGVPSSSVMMENWLTSIKQLKMSTRFIKLLRTLTIFPREQWFAFEHLSEYATGTPDIHGDVVLLPRQHDFWRTIVAC
jgi:hypothetical protein